MSQSQSVCLVNSDSGRGGTGHETWGIWGLVVDDGLPKDPRRVEGCVFLGTTRVHRLFLIPGGFGLEDEVGIMDEPELKDHNIYPLGPGGSRRSQHSLNH